MDWSILGIEATKDKKQITAAYRQKLPMANPEDKPEEFKALRAAYEEALALADQQDAVLVKDNSPVGLWMAGIAELYQDFQRRIDPMQWKKLLKADICQALDTRSAAEDALLQFLMEHYHIPKSVWLELDHTFDFSHRIPELCERYPEEFIRQFIVDGVHFDPVLPYELFVPGQNGEQCDAYCGLYYRAMQLNMEELPSLLDQMEALAESHPYGEFLRYRYLLDNGKETEGKDGIRRLAEAYPQDHKLCSNWAMLCLSEGDYAQAEAIAERILSSNEDFIPAKEVLSKCYAQRGKYFDAKELAFEIMQDCFEDPETLERCNVSIQEWNEKLIPQYLECLEDGKEDSKSLLELAWCYLQNDRDEEAEALIQRISPQRADPYEYHNLIGKFFYQRREHSQALEHLLSLEHIIRELREDGTKETKKRIRKLPTILLLQGVCMLNLEDYYGAKQKLDAALELAPEDPELLSRIGQVLFAEGLTEEAVPILERLVQAFSGTYFGRELLAICLYRLHRDREAFQATEEALAVLGNDLLLYHTKMLVMLRNGMEQEVRDTLAFLKDGGAPDNIATDYICARLIQKEDPSKALEEYKKLSRRLEAGENMLEASELYYHIALLTEESDPSYAMSQLDKGLALNKMDPDCLCKKAELLYNRGDEAEALELLTKNVKKNPHSQQLLFKLGGLYYEDLPLHALEAFSCYEQLSRLRQTADIYYYMATCKRFMGQLEEAETYYRKELDLDPQDVDGFNGLAYLYEARGNYEEALRLVDSGIQIMEEAEERYLWLLERRVQILRRMGQCHEALTYVLNMQRRYNYLQGFQLRFDICCQFGKWEEAKEVLHQWQVAHFGSVDRSVALGKLNLLQGNFMRATATMAVARVKLSAQQTEEFRLQLADLENNASRSVEIWRSRKKQNPDDSYILKNLAHALLLKGDLKEARKEAEHALLQIDAILQQCRTDIPLHRSSRSLLLAILGREEEARAELEASRRLPLCSHCEYCRCKDADIYEAQIEEILGNREKALELYQLGKELWPDDLDFHAGVVRLKGKKKC